jgi:hypothetical protein
MNVMRMKRCEHDAIQYCNSNKWVLNILRFVCYLVDDSFFFIGAFRLRGVCLHELLLDNR